MNREEVVKDLQEVIDWMDSCPYDDKWTNKSIVCENAKDLIDSQEQTIKELREEIEELNKNCSTCNLSDCGLSCSKDGTGIDSRWRKKQLD